MTKAIDTPIGGGSVAPASGRGAAVFNPATGEDVSRAGLSSAREEIFGPALSVFRAKDYGGAVDMINAREYGNGTAIFSRDGNAARASADTSPRPAGIRPGAHTFPQFSFPSMD